MKKETLGQRLRRLRDAAGITQESAALAVGVPPETYRNWEYDHRKPSTESALKLAAWLGVSVEDLYRDLAPAPKVPEPMPGRPRGRPQKPKP